MEADRSGTARRRGETSQSSVVPPSSHARQEVFLQSGEYLLGALPQGEASFLRAATACEDGEQRLTTLDGSVHGW